MELVTIRIDGGTRAGRVEGDEIVLLDQPTVKEVLLGGEASARADGPTVSLADADLAPVIPNPDKVVCVGANYRDHIEEMGRKPPNFPTYFAKFARSLTGPRDELPLPAPDVSDNVDWEAELAIVIGRPARNVSGDEALAAVAGYTVLNDVSVRDWQRRTTQFLAGKCFEGLTPLGPSMVTADVLGDGSGLAISTEVNGEVKQSSSTSNLVFGVVDIVSDLSRTMTLDPGDVIATGTPGGVGAAREPQEFLRPGDELVTTIEGIGQLVNRCR
jgi:acylpyruvate hydrolase